MALYVIVSPERCAIDRCLRYRDSFDRASIAHDKCIQESSANDLWKEWLLSLDHSPINSGGPTSQSPWWPYPVSIPLRNSQLAVAPQQPKLLYEARRRSLLRLIFVVSCLTRLHRLLFASSSPYLSNAMETLIREHKKHFSKTTTTIRFVLLLNSLPCACALVVLVHSLTG